MKYELMYLSAGKVTQFFYCHRDRGWAVPWQRLCSRCSIPSTLRTLPTGLASCWSVQTFACPTKWHWWDRHSVSYSRVRRSVVMRCESPCTWSVGCPESFSFIFYDPSTFSIVFQLRVGGCKTVTFITFKNERSVYFWMFPHLYLLWDFISC